MRKLITKAKAKAEGRTTYWSSGLCPKGHSAPRFVSNRACTQCARERGEPSQKRRSRYVRSWRHKAFVPTREVPARCECCNGTPTGIGALHLDHDHTTEKFRGWLCSKCNQGIGLLGDDIEGLLRGISYLAKAAE